MDQDGVKMEDLNKRLITDYLRLSKTRDLSHTESCEILQVDQRAMLSILQCAAYSSFISEKVKEFRMTEADMWHDVDKLIQDGFESEAISFILDVPVRQVVFRKHFLEKHLL